MRVEVHENDGFKLVRTMVPIHAGDVVMRLSRARVRSTPTRTSICIGPYLHAEDPVGSFINHSCNPSCKVDGSEIVALFNLPAGMEVTFDYTENEGPLASPFTCLDCGKLLTGSPSPCKD
jgi:hypothetical protein